MGIYVPMYMYATMAYLSPASSLGGALWEPAPGVAKWLLLGTLDMVGDKSPFLAGAKGLPRHMSHIDIYIYI